MDWRSNSFCCALLKCFCSRTYSNTVCKRRTISKTTKATHQNLVRLSLYQTLHIASVSVLPLFGIGCIERFIYKQRRITQCDKSYRIARRKWNFEMNLLEFLLFCMDCAVSNEIFNFIFITSKRIQLKLTPMRNYIFSEALSIKQCSD